MRGCAACFKASQARSISGWQARANAAMIGLRTAIHGLEVSIRSDGKTSFDHVHAETVKLISQAQLFLLIHGATGRLLSVAKSRVENRDACGHGSPLKTQLVRSYGATVAEVKLIILINSLVL